MDEREARFWAKVDRSGADDCWTWTASRDGDGYGQFWNPERRTMDLAHRYAFEQFVEALPPKPAGQLGPIGPVVMHTCDNPSCVNPAHLVLGTQADNVHDCITKGRLPERSGERNGRAKLTAETVATIRRTATGRYGERMQIAREYGISSGQVSKILAGQVWAA